MSHNRKKRGVSDLTLKLDKEIVSEMAVRDASKQACLLVIGGLDMGSVILVDKSVTTLLGRDPSCTYTVLDDGISRFHAEVFCEGEGRFKLKDLESTNGTFVEGKRIEDRVLSDGDKVLLGRHTILKFTFSDKMDTDFQKEMYESSVRDALTGAYNRKHFDERISSEISFARRHDSAVSLLMLDLDHFKKINDNYGHQAGDEVLSTVAGLISASLREEDIFARYGGEEFAIITRGINSQDSLALAERLRALVEEIIIRIPNGERIPITISVGVHTVPRKTIASPSELIKRADEQLYQAKQNGRNRVMPKIE